MSAFTRFIESGWYERRWKTVWLLPLSVVFWVVSSLRRQWLGFCERPAYPVPVVIIGNISVGGTGKTPLACTLIEELKEQGLRPGIISRGYLSRAPEYPYLVTSEDNACIAGDEPLLLAGRTGCPVVIGPDRNASVQMMTEQCDVDVILSDDGLQNYHLHRDYELIVVDSRRMFGNKWLLPAGPLREGVWRLDQADKTIVNGDPSSMMIQPLSWVNALSGERRGLQYFSGKKVTAVAGIGNPERFFSTLRDLGVTVNAVSFPDHHEFTEKDLVYDGTVVMTEKDWVKCKSFAGPDHWYLEVGALLADDVRKALIRDICQLVQMSENRGNDNG